MHVAQLALLPCTIPVILALSNTHWTKHTVAIDIVITVAVKSI
jgi:hypothetical protein